jgi:D-serine deaminase-like pyridoxal phosphate-dependent protein
MSAAACAMGAAIPFLIEVDVGLGRCGVPPGKPVLELLQKTSDLPSLIFRGLNGYEGAIITHDPEEKERRCRRSNELLAESTQLLRDHGFPVEIVSGGSSNTYQITAAHPGITEVQVGSYVTMDAHNAAYGIAFEQAVTVLTTVISRPTRERAITDAGKRSLSSDHGLPLCPTPGVLLVNLNDEHGHVRLEDPEHPLRIGDKLEIVPSHGCTTIPLFDEYMVIRNDTVVAVEPILPRGTMR